MIKGEILMVKDFRTNRTTNRIQHALITLLKTTPLDKVTITALIKVAKISRRSFYVHYQDKYALLKVIEDKIISDAQNTLAKEHIMLKPVDSFNDPRLLANTTQTFQNILKAMNGHRESLTVLLSDNGDPLFNLRFRQLIKSEIIARLKEYHAHLRTDIPVEYASTLLVSSLVDLIVIWLQKKKPESPAQFAQILTHSRMIAPLELLEFN